MRRSTMFALLVAMAVLAGLMMAAPAGAATFRTGDNVVIESSAVIDDDLYISGGTVSIEGTVNGDVVAAGGTISISGNVAGDLIAAGGTIALAGSVRETARLAGGTITVSGQVGQDLLAAGGNVNIGGEASIGRDLWTGAGNATVRGRIGRDLGGGVGSLVLSGEVGRNVKVSVDNLTLSSSATVLGDVTYYSDNRASIASDARVAGDITRKEPVSPRARRPSAAELFALRVISFILALAASAVLGIIIVLAAPKTSQAIADKIGSAPWASVGLGFALLIVTPVAGLIVALTVIGLPVSILAVFAYITALYAGKVFVGLFIGNRIFAASGRQIHPVWALLVGLTLVMIVGAIPILGFFARLAYWTFGMGAIVLALAEAYRQARAISGTPAPPVVEA